MRSLQRLAPALTIAAAFAAALWWSWGRWPDVLIDSGRELYVPWRLSQGAVLYRDVASFYGPLSSYFNAFVFLLLGPSLRSLVLVNLLIIVGVLVALYALSRQYAGRAAATLGLLTFIGLLGFSQYSWVGGNNWVLPYSHEATHGVALALASLWALLAFARKGSRWLLMTAGLATGLAFLTKPEPFVATLVVNGVLLAAVLPARGRPLSDLAVWSLGALAPVSVCVLAFAAALPVREALTATAGAWRYVFSELQAQHTFHQWIMGTDSPLERATRLLTWTGGYVLIFGLPALAGRFVRRGAPAAAVFSLVGATVMAVAIQQRWIHWSGFASPLPLGMLALAVCAAIQWRKNKAPAAMARLGMAVLGLALLARVILHVTIDVYGYILAAPALVMGVVVLGDDLPGRIRRAGGSGAPLQAVAVVAWVGLLWVHLTAGGRYYASDTVRVGAGGDAFCAPADRARAVNAILNQLANTRPSDTLVVLPEGVMLNYLARRINPTSYVSFMPSEFSMFGQDHVLASLAAHPPDYIALVDKDTSEYGPRYFGTDYGQPVFQWVLAHYTSLGVAGELPLTGRGFGIMLLRKKPEAQ